jgi:hypothetical protein
MLELCVPQRSLARIRMTARPRQHSRLVLLLIRAHIWCKRTSLGRYRLNTGVCNHFLSILNRAALRSVQQILDVAISTLSLHLQICACSWALTHQIGQHRSGNTTSRSTRGANGTLYRAVRRPRRLQLLGPRLLSLMRLSTLSHLQVLDIHILT